LRADELRAAFFLARVRAPLRADALRAALLRLRVPAAFLAAALRPRFFAAAMLSLHDEFELSPAPRWNRRVLHRVLTSTRVTKQLRPASIFPAFADTTSSQSLIVTRREYRMQEMCVQSFLAAIAATQSSLPKASRRYQVRIPRMEENFFLASQRSSCT
jgi:hypothetical protein